MKNKPNQLAWLALVCLAMLGCSQEEVGPGHSQNAQPGENADKPAATQRVNPANARLTANFRGWLASNGYAADNFAGSPGQSYGGRATASTPVANEPVIFIHGNSDKAVGTAFGQTGWTSSINYFLGQGYGQSELYAITWGPANAREASDQVHSRAYLTRIRRFIQAVKDYTGADKVDVVGHSMGVTLSRKAIKGGQAFDQVAGGDYNLGPRLGFVDTFVGIAGANLGLSSCFFSSTLPTCNDRNGFYPGYIIFGAGPFGVSDFLTGLNDDTAKEGDHVYTIWSTVDQLIGSGGLVYGKYTCQIPRQDGERRFTSFPYGHFGLKDNTTSVQYQMVRFQRTN